MDQLRAHGKEFVSMSEALDTSSAMGRFVMDILQRIAQLESEQIGERTLMGMTTKAGAGQIALGQKVPYGYRWSKPSPKGKWWGSGEWVINEVEAKEIRAVFDRFLKGLGALKIGESLGWCTCTAKLIHRVFRNKDGSVRRYDGYEKRSHCAGCSRIRYMLRNPAYAGYFVFAGRVLKGSHKPIVTREKFEKVQARFAARRWTHPGAWTPLPDES
jgi:DNA invertase Pin-like site-specific DNA recombinase